MKPHPRIRKTIKWGGAAASVLLVAVWIVSGWWLIHWTNADKSTYSLDRGCACIWGPPDFASGDWPEGLQTLPHPFEVDWVLSASTATGMVGCCIPLWIPTAFLLLSTMNAWHLDILARRREREGKCPKCTYDRTGLAKDAVCPECGAAPIAASKPTESAPHA